MSQILRPILVECKPDEVLIRALGVPRRRIFHHSGKGNICNRLRRLKNAIAIMDEDPHSSQPRYLRELMSSVAEEGAHQIRVLRDDERGHLILILRPRLEGWILHVARRNGIRPQSFGLPDQEEALHGEMIYKLPDLERWIRQLKEAGSEELEFLRRWLE
ncbi:hypothetical protein [Thermoflexus sp.]|uniref:hypothetical protein n=1 Tax=Thermoflexus sp. TaxID=1969742 RepID=UPI002ADDAC44|nr:hypothetical protein [Thermoflexus sp.]